MSDKVGKVGEVGAVGTFGAVAAVGAAAAAAETDSVIIGTLIFSLPKESRLDILLTVCEMVFAAIICTRWDRIQCFLSVAMFVARANLIYLRMNGFTE